MEGHPLPEARQLTREEVEVLSERAFTLEVKIKESYAHVHEAWWDLARYLYEFQERGAWALLGYDKLEEFLAQPDLGMSRSQYFLMVKLWRDLVETREIPPADLHGIEPTKVRAVTPAIMSGEVSIEEALADAKARGYRDLRDDAKYNPGKGKADSSKSLDAETEPELEQCERCGSWVPPERLDHE